MTAGTFLQRLPLGCALEFLGVPAEWLQGFSEAGEHYAEIRLAWRKLVLQVRRDRG